MARSGRRYYFNPHSHEGSDTFYMLKFGKFVISIHTPTRGVTGTGADPRPGARDFNPHSHEGSDIFYFSLYIQFCDFNPHSHEGSDPEHGSVAWWEYNFNPHSHEGSDQRGYYVDKSSVISIHTPTRGVTAKTGLDNADTAFQSTLPRGE